MVMLQAVTLMEGEWTMVLMEVGMEVASLKEGEWSCYSLMESIVMLLRWPVLMEREWSFYGGYQFNGGRMVMLQVVTLMEREWTMVLMEVGMEVASLKEGEWSCYSNGEHCHVTEVASFNGERMVILRRLPV